jgi:hypothetical protein
MENDFVAVAATLSVTLAVNVQVPAVVNVPVITPADERLPPVQAPAPRLDPPPLTSQV